MREWCELDVWIEKLEVISEMKWNLSHNEALLGDVVSCCPAYGMTECVSVSHVTPKGVVNYATVGKAIPNLECKVSC